MAGRRRWDSIEKLPKLHRGNASEGVNELAPTGQIDIKGQELPEQVSERHSRRCLLPTQGRVKVLDLRPSE